MALWGSVKTLGPQRSCDTAAVKLYGLHYIFSVLCVCMCATYVEICVHATIQLF